jgi:molybdenum cofactor cytidylyltransferase
VIHSEVFHGKVAGIILAAGASRRMGSPKALLDYRGETFVSRLIRVFSGVCEPVIVVAGVHGSAITEHVGGSAKVVINPDPDRGQLSSLQTALAVTPADCEGFLFTPVDCPTVDERTVAILMDRLRDGDAPFVIPRFSGKRGHPVCVRGSLIAEFLAQPPTDETRAIVNRHEAEIEYVDVPDAGVLADIDDMETYLHLLS